MSSYGWNSRHSDREKATKNGKWELNSGNFAAKILRCFSSVESANPSAICCPNLFVNKRRCFPQCCRVAGKHHIDPKFNTEREANFISWCYILKKWNGLSFKVSQFICPADQVVECFFTLFFYAWMSQKQPLRDLFCVFYLFLNVIAYNKAGLS